MNYYVPWDTSYLTTFLNFVKSNIGAAATVGVLIFAVTFGIPLVIKVIRSFVH